MNKTHNFDPGFLGSGEVGEQGAGGQGSRGAGGQGAGEQGSRGAGETRGQKLDPLILLSSSPYPMTNDK
ncbi:MAG: hypothetical protein V7K61_25370 [Nostoc sp.]